MDHGKANWTRRGSTGSSRFIVPERCRARAVQRLKSRGTAERVLADRFISRGHGMRAEGACYPTPAGALPKCPVTLLLLNRPMRFRRPAKSWFRFESTALWPMLE